MLGSKDEIIAERISIAEAADLCDSILDSGKFPIVTAAEEGYTVTARAYSGGFRPYTRWPIRIFDHTLRFRVTKPYKAPYMVPFVYPKDRGDYERLLSEHTQQTWDRLEQEAADRYEERVENYKRTREHIEEKLGPEVTSRPVRVPQETIHETIDSILRRGYFTKPDDGEE